MMAALNLVGCNKLPAEVKAHKLVGPSFVLQLPLFAAVNHTANN